MVLAVLGAYFALVLGVGIAAARVTRGTGEDFFAASRTIGSVVMLLSLFGTHMTAFSLLGASGEAYHRGLGVFSLMASSSALVVPVLILLLAPRVFALGHREGFLTQAELFAARFESRALGLLLAVVLTLLLLPYLLIGVLGGGITLAEITGGSIPQWAGSLLVSAVVMAYVTLAGARGAAWVNSLQTVVFMGLGLVAAVVLVRSLGGLSAALARVDPALLVHGDRVTAAALFSYSLLPLSAAAFPHLFLHWLTARNEGSFRLTVVAYPLCLLPVWVPSVLLGVLGSAAIPGLLGPQSNSILVQLIVANAPPALSGLLAAGVLAAIMSSLDSQALALSTLFTRGVGGSRDTGPGQVRRARLLVMAVVALTYLVSLGTQRSIFRLGEWSFTGFAALAPLVFAALYWKRATRAGAYASVITAVVLWGGFYWAAGSSPGYSVAGTGLLPVVVIVPASALALVVVSLVTRPASSATLERFFPTAGAGR